MKSLMGLRSVNSKRNIAAGLISNILVLGFGFIARTAIVVCFNEQYLGLVSVYGSVIAVLNLAEMGFSSAIVANLYRPLNDGDEVAVRGILSYYRKSYRIIGAVILFAGLAVMPFIDYIVKDAERIEENIYVIYVVYLLDASVSYFLFAYKEALINAAQRYDLVKTIYTAVYVLRNLAQLYIVIFINNFYVYVAFFVISTIANNVCIQFISKRYYPQFYCEGEIGDEEKKGLHKNIVGAAVGKISEVARNSLDSIIIACLFGLETVAIYNNYFYIYNAVMGICWTIVTAIQASVGNSIVSEPVGKNASDFRKFEMIYSIFITGCAVYMVSLFQPFMKLWMGEKIMFSDLNMALFVVYFYSTAMNGIRNAYFNALGLWWAGRWIAVGEAASNLILNVLLGKAIGVTGVLLATIVTMVAINYLCNTKLLFSEYFHVGLGRYLWDRLVYTLIATVSCCISYACARNLSGFQGIGGLLRIFFVDSVVVAAIVPFLFFTVRQDLCREAHAYMRSLIGADSR